MRTAKTSKLSF